MELKLSIEEAKELKNALDFLISNASGDVGTIAKISNEINDMLGK